MAHLLNDLHRECIHLIYFFRLFTKTKLQHMIVPHYGAPIPARTLCLAITEARGICRDISGKSENTVCILELQIFLYLPGR